MASVFSAKKPRSERLGIPLVSVRIERARDASNETLSKFIMVLVAEMANASRYHHQAMCICGIDHFIIAHAATRVNHASRACGLHRAGS